MDMDWDDEDEKTSVYEKGGSEDAAHALLHSGPPPAAGRPAPRPGPAAGAPPPPPSLRSGPRSETPVRMPPPPSALVGRAPGSRKLVVAIMMAGLLVVALVGLSILKPFGSGSLLVTVAGPNNKAIDAVDISIGDDMGAVKKSCPTSPCSAPKLKPGMYLLRIKAPGYDSPAPEAIQVDSGKSIVKRVALSTASKGTGLKVTAKGAGPFRLSVDGKDQGLLPATVTDLEPGEHTVRITDKRDRYEPFEQKVTVSKGEMLELNPALKVLRGLAKITPGQYADGARVVLVSGNERRPLPKIPIAIEIKLDKPYQLVATRAGFQDFETPVTFEDGEAEKTFEIALTMAAARPVAAPRVAVAPVSRGRRTAAPTAPAAAAPAAGGGNGTIAINSIPVSNVTVDGRPVGSTPTRWSGAPGAHTVTFVHPDFGRKTQTITVKAGGTAVAAVRFP